MTDAKHTPGRVVSVDYDDLLVVLDAAKKYLSIQEAEWCSRHLADNKAPKFITKIRQVIRKAEGGVK